MLSARNAACPKPCTRRSRNPTTSTHGVCTAATSAAVTRYTRAAVPSAKCSTRPTVVRGWWIRRRSVMSTVASIEPATAAAATAYGAGVGTPPSVRAGDSAISSMGRLLGVTGTRAWSRTLCGNRVVGPLWAAERRSPKTRSVRAVDRCDDPPAASTVVGDSREDDMDTEGRRRTVIVGVDGSEEALRAVRWAVPEARRRQATLRLVTAFAWTDDRMVGWPGLGQAAYGERLRAAAEHDLAAAASVAAQLDPDLPVEQDLVLGFPGGVLVDQARGAELLVVGDNGRGRLGSVLAGSVAVGVAAHAACPVVVVRGVEPLPDERLPVVVGIDGTP